MNPRKIGRGLGIWTLLGWALGGASSALAQSQPTLIWGTPAFTTANPSEVSGTAYTPVAVAHGGTGTATFTVTITGDNGYSETASGIGGTSTPAVSVTDTGNKYVHYTATASSTDGYHMTIGPLAVQIYVPDNPPQLVGGLTLVGQPTWSQFEVAWSPANDGQLVDHYLLAGGPAGTVPVAAPNPQPSGYTYTFAANPSTTYSITLQAVNFEGQTSSTSAALSVTTPIHDTTPPTAPGAITFANIVTSRVSVSWGASTDNVAVASYTATLLNAAGTVVETANVTSPGCDFSGLAQGTSYHVSVVAVDTSGNQSTATVSSSFTTQGSPVPGPLTVSGVQATSFTVSWPPLTLTPATASYQLTLNGETPITVSASQLSYTFPGLTASTTYTVVLGATSTSGVASANSAPFSLTTDIPLVTLPTVTRPTGSGSIVPRRGGELTVDNHGAANYSIPLQIPAGRSSLEPKLALTYNSGVGNGVAGVGWQVETGFYHAITRGRNILARDGLVESTSGVAQGVTFTSNDKFYLDGKRLICQNGQQYGTPGSIYHTEVESFLTVTAYGSGSGIDYFVAVDKQGVQYTFGKVGTVLDGYQEGGGEPSGLAYSYALKQVQDTLGNTVAFTYSQLGGGEYVLSEIDYTGGPVAPAAQVLFAYEARPDQPVTYIANRAFNHRARLAAITAKLAGNTTAAYGLNYDNASASQRSRLISVSPVLADPATGNLYTSTPVQIGWQKFNETMATPATPYTPDNSHDIQWADTKGTGVDQPVQVSNRTNQFVKLGDFDGDGRQDTLTYTLGGGITITTATGVNLPIDQALIASYFVDPPNGTGTTTTLLQQAEGIGLASRITVADFTGDGRDDILVHGFDGRVHLFISTGTGFLDPVASDNLHAPFVYGNGDVNWEWDVMHQGNFNTWIGDHYYVKPIPCDLNGDGITDYVCLTYQRFLKYNGTGTTATGFATIRNLVGVISNGDGTFSAPFPIGGPAMMVPTETNDTGNAVGNIPLTDMVCGPFVGDFNGDGLPDFLILVPQFEMQSGLYSGVYQSQRWALYLNQGMGPGGIPNFVQYNGAIPNTKTLPTAAAETVNTYYTPVLSNGGGWLNGPVQYIAGPTVNSSGQNFIAGLEGSAGSINNYVMDVNHDGLADLVWYVGYDQNENAISGADAGWYAMLSTGNFSGTMGSGFVGPVKLTSMSNVPAPNPIGNAPTPFVGNFLDRSLDYNGDGERDYFLQPQTNGIATTGGSVFVAAPANDGSSAKPLTDLVTSIVDGLGRITKVDYKAAKDSTIYTPGAAVRYPIRDLRSSEPVVADVFQDAGGTAPLAQYSYQYSGNRLDLSGRGSLGFHSFVTLDQQTSLFKYQFLAQSFPMTGLTALEQTYRFWSVSSASDFRLLTSQANTVVFDEVKNGSILYETVFPFVSQSVENRWEDSTTAHFSLSTSGVTESSQPEALFPNGLPSGAFLTVTAQSLFDAQTSPQTTIPNVTGYYASDDNSTTNSSGVVTSNANVAVGTSSFSIFDSLPRNISYGNLMQLTTTYDSGVTDTVTSTYYSPTASAPLTGLVHTAATTKTANGYTDSAPTLSFTYFNATPLVSVETHTASDSRLSFSKTYNRDSLGRVTSTVLAGDAVTTDDQYLGTYTTSSVGAWDATLDLPTQSLDAYGHQTTTSYYEPAGLPNSVTDVNGAQVTTQYDALWRPLVTKDVLRSLQTSNTYNLDSTQTTAPPSGCGGIAETSVYSRVTTETVKPTVTTYFDRLDRVIRTIKHGFNSQLIYTDTAYNNIGQVVAVSLPYLQGATSYWTVTTYDPLGRVATVTAPNGKVTTNTYYGRATQRTVTAPSAPSETDVVLNDAKGEMIKTWNANNVPGSIDLINGGNTSPSVALLLDGFGRMRLTTLAGQTQTISATYDALGNQLSLADPDKGSWAYVANALGQVIRQTDAKGDVTVSSFDELGRILSKTLSEASSGPVQSASWYYYDTAANLSLHPNLMNSTSEGWIGALARENSATTGAPGYGDPGSTTAHYYDSLGRPIIDVNLIDNTWFYTATSYDTYSRVSQVQRYWRPGTHESPSDMPYTWSSFGYSYTYDGSSYLLSLQDTTAATRQWWAVDASSGFDYLDRPVLVRKGDGYWTQRTYNPLDGTLTAIKTGITEGAAQIQNLAFGYDGLGNLLSRSDSIHGASETFSYDSLNRLLSSADGSVSYYSNGNFNTKTDINQTSTSYTYDSVHPHAVAGAWGYSLGYDANGNVVSRTKTGESWNFRWAGFDMPRWMAKTTSATTAGTEFVYNADHSRVLQLKFSGLTGGVPSGYTLKRAYGLGPDLEVDYMNTASSGSPVWKNSDARVYITAPDGVVGTAEFTPTPSGGGVSLNERDEVYHYDHIGSIEAITPAFDTTGTLSATSGGASGLYSEDAWGERRNPSTYVGPPTTTDGGGVGGLSPRGFTKHEMLDEIGLVHMNGRIYDPLIGRFLSADRVIQAPNELQSYNRYSYVKNNPLTLTDPTGFEASSSNPLDNLFKWAAGLFSIKNPNAGGGPRSDSKNADPEEHLAKASALKGVENALNGAQKIVNLESAGIKAITPLNIALNTVQAATGKNPMDPTGITPGSRLQAVEELGIQAFAPAAMTKASGLLGTLFKDTIEAFAAKNVATRTFTSTDPLVGDLANKIEALYPGHVVGVNVPLNSSLGATDADILLQNAVIQVKSGGSAQGLLLQLQKSEAATGLPSLGFGPNLPANSLRALSQQGGLVTGDENLLLEVVKP